MGTIGHSVAVNPAAASIDVTTGNTIAVTHQPPVVALTVKAGEVVAVEYTAGPSVGVSVTDSTVHVLGAATTARIHVGAVVGPPGPPGPAGGMSVHGYTFHYDAGTGQLVSAISDDHAIGLAYHANGDIAVVSRTGTNAYTRTLTYDDRGRIETVQIG